MISVPTSFPEKNGIEKKIDAGGKQEVNGSPMEVGAFKEVPATDSPRSKSNALGGSEEVD